MPRLFLGAETIPGLTHPTETFDDAMTLDLGNRSVELRHLGRGHTSGDIVVWLPDEGIFFAGDLVEAQAAPYMGEPTSPTGRRRRSTTLPRSARSSWSAAAGRSCAARPWRPPSRTRARSCARRWTARARSGTAAGR